MNITGGFLNSRKIKVIEQSNIKPTLSKVRQGIFNALSTIIDFKNKTFLDMFSGSGIMAFEAYSRGFIITAFEKDKLTYNEIKKNSKILNIEGTFLLGNSIKLINKTENKFDIVYIDPPYDSELYEKALNAIIENDKLTPEGIVILEHKTERAINCHDWEIIKTKAYADKTIDFLKLK